MDSEQKKNPIVQRGAANASILPNTPQDKNYDRGIAQASISQLWDRKSQCNATHNKHMKRSQGMRGVSTGHEGGQGIIVGKEQAKQQTFYVKLHKKSFGTVHAIN